MIISRRQIIRGRRRRRTKKGNNRKVNTQKIMRIA